MLDLDKIQEFVLDLDNNPKINKLSLYEFNIRNNKRIKYLTLKFTKIHIKIKIRSFQN